MAGLCLTLCSGGIAASAAPVDNLLLHRAYVCWPAPNYGLTKDAGDATQLTDGQTSSGEPNPLWRRKSTVGWALPLNEPAVIWFDLGAPASLNELHFDTTSGNSGSGVVDVGLRVYASLDDRNYFLAGERPAPNPDSLAKVIAGQQMTVPLDGCRARYLAVAAMAPAPYYFVFADEIELLGSIPADVHSALPVVSSIVASGAQGLQEALSGGLRARQLMTHLLAPIDAQLKAWPPADSARQAAATADFEARGAQFPEQSAQLRAAAIESHRTLARAVYGVDTLTWEVTPDAAFGPLSLPDVLQPAARAGIDTVTNALEATALGAANLTATDLPLHVTVATTDASAPAVTARVARFFVTTNAHWVPDALLATDSPENIPSGQSKMIWLEAASNDARAGVYHYSVNVGIGDTLHTIALTVTVHGVTLSKSTPLATFDWSYLNGGRGLPVYTALRDAMLDHRVTVAMNSLGALPSPARDAAGQVILPLQLDFTEMDKTLDLHRDFSQIGWFLPFNVAQTPPSGDLFGPAPWMSDQYKSIFGEWLQRIVAHMKERGRGYDRFFFQNFDESLDPKVAQLCTLMHQIDPRLRVMCTIPEATAEATRQLVDSGMNIFCYHAPRLGYRDAPDGFPILTQSGRALWFYGAADSAFGDGKERAPLGFYRLMFWKAFAYRATGVGFWDLCINNGHSPVWTDEDSSQIYWPQVYVNAPGFPAPPADIKTAEEVIPSRRFEYQRMGTEDYMLLRMTQDAIAALPGGGQPYRQRLDDIVQIVLTRCNDDGVLFREQRLRLVELAEQLTALRLGQLSNARRLAGTASNKIGANRS